MIHEKQSPFQPRTPVSPDKLEGRIGIINDYIRYLSLAVNGQPQHFYLNGNRGVGKSSVASYLLEYTKLKYNMVGIHVYNDGVHTVDDLINNIIEELLNEIKNESWSKKIINSFKKHVESVGFLGNSIKFKPTDEEITKNIKDSFDYFLVDLISNFEDKNGLFIVIDDIDGLSETNYFANWYKSLADALATNFDVPIPLVVMLTSHPKVVKLLYKHNPSFNRNFVYRSIDLLSKDEVKDFFIKIFNSQDITIDDDALKLMVEFSAGSPTMMQNIGDEIYWINNEENISKDTATKGIKKASKEIELRYLQNTLNDFNMNNNDLNILRVLGKDFINNSYEKYCFSISNISKYLSKFDEEVFEDFIAKALKTEIIEIKGDESTGEYRFTNDLYPIYFAIENFI